MISISIKIMAIDLKTVLFVVFEIQKKENIILMLLM
jgi:hypothetical protein